MTDFNPDGDKPFRWSDYPQTQKKVKDIQNGFARQVSTLILRGTSEEWKNSNVVQDLLANKVLKAYSVINSKGEEFKRYYQTNSDALKAFQQRKISGMNLSKRVWDLSEQYKGELEFALSVGTEKGASAAQLARQVKKYLKEPDRLYRRVRDKYGNLVLSKNAKLYHPGRGVYRSSYKNAMRLTRSEINMAYRQAENLRWQQMDFVVGYEIKLSSRHPHHDICDDLKGKYPKDFVWTGWHPNDMCYKVSILKTEEEFWNDQWRGNQSAESVNAVTDVPPQFKQWVGDNAERINRAEARGTLPYFVRDNREIVHKVGTQITKNEDAHKSTQVIKLSPEEVEKHLINAGFKGFNFDKYNESIMSNFNLVEFDKELESICNKNSISLTERR